MTARRVVDVGGGSRRVDPMAATRVDVPTRLLVSSMLRHDGSIDVGELYDVANMCRMSDQQVRLCIRRLVDEGKFSHEGRGRKARLVARAGHTAPHDNMGFVRLAFRQDQGRAPWDGVWRLAAFAVPESARRARDSLREAILFLGGAPVQGGLYVSANSWDEILAAKASRLDVRAALTLASTTDLRVGRESDPPTLAAQLWPIDEVATGYRRLLDVVVPRRDALAGSAPPQGPALTRLAIEVAVAFDEAIVPDPLLPPELLPSPWIGAQARAVVAEVWHLLGRRYDRTQPELFRTYDTMVGEILGGKAATPG